LSCVPTESGSRRIFTDSRAPCGSPQSGLCWMF